MSKDSDRPIKYVGKLFTTVTVHTSHRTDTRESPVSGVRKHHVPHLSIHFFRKGTVILGSQITEEMKTEKEKVL